ncbi:phage tail sheath C-terminal domain-containing protein [Candidatus Regiella insecticola]|uniref:Phage tail sheath protein FI n=1 Tax=Candidatus Regiella insecticola TaxID=138073 RepID=A0A6L2ZND5_9ENTR|nr:phage tail sheath C-terminal domain-containing protein [Candidatus Regiella insecticola]GFN46367.1 phage tail sheath protein FI [Candidatus Regiella insecticola]
MSEQFLHGIEVVEIDTGTRPIRTVRASVIGLVGTAPDADAEVFPFDTPVLIAGSRLETAKLGKTGTLPAAIDGIFDQTGAVVVIIRINESSAITTARKTVAEKKTLVTTKKKDLEGKNKELAAASNTQRAAVEATLTAAKKELETEEKNLTEEITKLKKAETEMIKGGVNETTGAYTGVKALLAAQSKVGVTPRILIAPGFTHIEEVTQEMWSIADQLRAIIIADGPCTNDAAAIKYRGKFGSARVYLVDPQVQVSTTGDQQFEPASARVAGVLVKSDAERGFWWSPSNREIYGIIGTHRPIDFAFGNKNARANILNEQDIATIIQQDGYRLWGNRTCASDKKWAFLSVRRTADMVNESLLQNHLWALDRNISKTYVSDVSEGVNAYLRHLTAQGAVLGGKCWADPDLNTPEQIKEGKVCFNFDFTPPYPAEHITFRSHLVGNYLEEIVK